MPAARPVSGRPVDSAVNRQRRRAAGRGAWPQEPRMRHQALETAVSARAARLSKRGLARDPGFPVEVADSGPEELLCVPVQRLPGSRRSPLPLPVSGAPCSPTPRRIRLTPNGRSRPPPAEPRGVGRASSSVGPLCREPHRDRRRGRFRRRCGSGLCLPQRTRATSRQ